ncbi:hypothetical protein [Desulfovibrio sp. Huiquan2017]|nr:hypothetical protein [Desulfovibrio sp. Huiquan2017]
MFKDLTAARILEIVLGSRAWLNYMDSYKSWSEDWAKIQHP